jgi:hypothetical protein
VTETPLRAELLNVSGKPEVNRDSGCARNSATSGRSFPEKPGETAIRVVPREVLKKASRPDVRV